MPRHGVQPAGHPTAPRIHSIVAKREVSASIAVVARVVSTGAHLVARAVAEALRHAASAETSTGAAAGPETAASMSAVTTSSSSPPPAAPPETTATSSAAGPSGAGRSPAGGEPGGVPTTTPNEPDGPTAPSGTMPSSGPNGGATSAGSGATAAGESGSAGGASTAGGSTSSPDGAITAGDSKTSCIYVRYANLTFEPALTAAEQATGVTFNCLTTYIDATTTWQEWEVPWIDDPGYAFTGWEAADPSHRTLVLATDLVPTSVDEPNGSPDPQAWESACAAGDDNGHATALAQNLVASGFGNAVIRLGLEMNGNWEPDYAGTTAAEQHQWAACFAQEVGAMRSVSGAHFLFDWNVNACVDDDVLSNLYPGNAYVDIIGIDAYDAFCNGSAPSASASSFQALAAEPDGLNAVTAFAEQQGKPMSLPEWGTVATAANGGFGLGDDGFYVSGIGQWVASHDVAFQSYFDHDSSSILPLATSEPNTLSAYRAAFS